MKLDLPDTTHKNSKWIKDLNLRVKTIKCLEVNTGTIFATLDSGSGAFGLTPKAQATKTTMKR